MRNFLLSLSVGLLIGIGAYMVVADTTTTVTNRGQVIIVKTLDNVATDVRDLNVYQDYSQYPTKPGDHGQIIRFYSFSTQGGAASSTINLLPAIPLADNMLIRGGYVSVMTAVAPADYTNSLEIQSTADLKASASNNFCQTGIKAIVPVGTTATAIQMSSGTNLVRFIIPANTLTAGKFMVVLDVDMVP